MKTKAVVTLGLLTLFAVFSIMPANAWAGSPQSYRWEGVAIGVGAAIIGTALIKACQNANDAGYAADRPEPVRYSRRPPAPAGHWESRREWVPPVYEKTWNPGHYGRNGRWIPGHWIQVETRAGYWTEQNVWISTR